MQGIGIDTNDRGQVSPSPRIPRVVRFHLGWSPPQTPSQRSDSGAVWASLSPKADWFGTHERLDWAINHTPWSTFRAFPISRGF